MDPQVRDDEIREHDGSWAAESWIFHRKIRKARKQYDCACCSEPIEKGTHYVEYVTAGQEGLGMETWRLHGECYIEGLSMLNAEPRPPWRWKPSEEFLDYKQVQRERRADRRARRARMKAGT
jgi:hypothetical protein